ncbi:Rv2175c family DNA-binding protein [Arcanobacterium hippocoleae]
MMDENKNRETVHFNQAESGEWLSIPEVAGLLGVRQRDVRAMLAKNELVAVRRGANNSLLIHRLQLTENDGIFSVLTALKGTYISLSDAGFSDEEKIAWILEFNAELDAAPIAALHSGRVHSVRRAIMTA